MGLNLLTNSYKPGNTIKIILTKKFKKKKTWKSALFVELLSTRINYSKFSKLTEQVAKRGHSYLGSGLSGFRNIYEMYKTERLIWTIRISVLILKLIGNETVNNCEEIALAPAAGK